MDKFEKIGVTLGVALVVTLAIAALALFGVGIWAFIELINWVVSK